MKNLLGTNNLAYLGNNVGHGVKIKLILSPVPWLFYSNLLKKLVVLTLVFKNAASKRQPRFNPSLT